MSNNQDRRWIFRDATIQSVDDDDIDWVERRGDRLVLLWGPTGAGKSRFVEVLAGDGEQLGISKDQLDSVTQKIETYELIFTEMWQGPGTEPLPYTRGPEDGRMYILDTPGFSDSQISEIEILEMVKDWMKTHNCSGIQMLLYFFPITDIRLSGSKRRAIQTLKLLSRINGEEPGSVLVATTMWDRLWNKRNQKAAEERFVQLRDEIWKDLLETGGLLTKFRNTHESGFEILMQSWSMNRGKSRFVTFVAGAIDGINSRDYGKNVYQDLLDRISNTHQQIQNLNIGLAEPEAQTNQTLNLLLEERLRNAERLLTKFETQLVNIGDPPPGFESVIPLRQEIIEKHRQRDAQAAAPSSTNMDDGAVDRLLHEALVYRSGPGVATSSISSGGPVASHDTHPPTSFSGSPSRIKRIVKGMSNVKSKFRKDAS
ncbi:hypothetical protein BJ165DRAFT_265151 [Panaeolus papilionaceus]|nr:hypothetical protein BJ165DRAFT_265151 [Panaeolus papilionaceus]